MRNENILLLPSRQTMVTDHLTLRFARALRRRNVEVDAISVQDVVADDFNRRTIVVTDESSGRFLRIVRTHAPQALIAIADPKMNNSLPRDAYDFALVSSIEQQNFCTERRIRSTVVYWTPELPHLEHLRRDTDDKLRIVYHGNKVHLYSMTDTVIPALNRLHSETPLHLELHYDIAKLGLWRTSEGPFPVRHVQWSQPNVWRSVASADIGIVPALQSQSSARVPPTLSKVASRLGLNRENRSSNDITLRMKMTSNLGRLYPYAHYAVPVVADLTPSVASILTPGVNGEIAYSSESWYRGLNNLASSQSKRRETGAHLREILMPLMDVAKSVERFLELAGQVRER